MPTLKSHPLGYCAIVLNAVHLKKLPLCLLCHCLKILSTLKRDPLIYFVIPLTIMPTLKSYPFVYCPIVLQYCPP
jgi:hypothetical protein